MAEKVQLPRGYALTWGGQFENQQRAAKRLAIVIPRSIGLIFILLFSTFRSVRQSLLVLSNVPLALIGGVFGMLISGEYLSVSSSAGFISVLGIAVLNGVMMVNYFNQLRAMGVYLSTPPLISSGSFALQSLIILPFRMRWAPLRPSLQCRAENSWPQK